MKTSSEERKMGTHQINNFDKQKRKFAQAAQACGGSGSEALRKLLKIKHKSQ